MQISLFPFHYELHTFTSILTTEITQFQTSRNCPFVPFNRNNCNLWLPDADRLEWDPCPNNISYGRWYEYQQLSPPINQAIPVGTNIWIGLEITRCCVLFSVWLDRHNAPNYHGAFSTKQAANQIRHSSILSQNTSPDFFIVRLNSSDFETYCNAVRGVPTNNQGANILQQFFTEVFT